MAATVITLIIGLAGTSWQAWVASNERDAARTATKRSVEAARKSTELLTRAKQLEADALSQREEAIQARLSAEEETAIAVALKSFLQEDLLGMTSVENQFNAHVQPNPNITIKEILLKAESTIDAMFGAQPRLHAEIQGTVGVCLGGLGEHTEGIKLLEASTLHFEENLGPKSERTHQSWVSLLRLYRTAGRKSKAVSVGKKLVAAAEQLFGGDHPRLLSYKGLLGDVLFDQRDLEEAIAIQEFVLKRLEQVQGEEHPDTIFQMIALAISYGGSSNSEISKMPLSVPLAERALALHRKVSDSDDPLTIVMMGLVARVYDVNGKKDSAAAIFAEILPLSQSIYGSDHGITISIMRELAMTYGFEKWPERMELLNDALALARKSIPRAPITDDVLIALSREYGVVADYKKSVALAQEALELGEVIYSDDILHFTTALRRLAVHYGWAGRNNERIKTWEKIHSLTQQANWDAKACEGIAMELAKAYESDGYLAKSISFYRLAFDGQAERGERSTRICLNALINCYNDAGDNRQAIGLSEDQFVTASNSLANISPAEREAQNGRSQRNLLGRPA